MTEQEKREKVIERLELAEKNHITYDGDEYGREYDYAHVELSLLCDTIALLKAQEPVKPIYRYGTHWCGGCNREIDRYDGIKYCPTCGRTVKW